MEKYKHTQKWFLGSEIKKTLVNHLQTSSKNTILEIGCFEGLSSVFFADTFLEHPSSSLTCVDPFMTITDNDHKQFITHSVESNFDYNIGNCKYPSKITVNKITSDDFFLENTKKYNFIYIDGCHEPDFIERDMKNAFAVLEEGGILWMDDYLGDDGIKIKASMDTILKSFQGKYDIIHSGYQLAIRKRKKSKKMLIDGFLFYNELDMLEYRLTLLDSVVDKFILVESTHTFVGNPKQLFYKENKDRYKRWESKIVHVVMDDPPILGNAWENEKRQRCAIDRGIQKLQLEEDDCIAISDVDEILDPHTLTVLKCVGLDDLYSFSQGLFYYNLTNFLSLWTKAKILPYSIYKDVYNRNCETIRMARILANCKCIERGGWHMSYFGSPTFIQNKIKNFSHQECNTEENTKLETIQTRVEKGESCTSTQKIRKIPLEQNSYLPPNLELYHRFFKNE